MIRREMRRWLALAVLCLAVAAPVATAISYFASPGEITDPIAGPRYASPNLQPGLKRPEVVPAARAGLPDDEPVVGVAAGGRFRAYRVAALSAMTSHVVNDLVGVAPVTVTYCDKTDCVAAFTADRTGEPLDVWCGGFVDGLLLRINDRYFMQETGRPYGTGADEPQVLQSFPITRTTWGAWRAAHPDTDVYVGDVKLPASK